MRLKFPASVGVWILFAAGCVQPLGPGYHFDDRQAEIRVSDDTTGRIHFRVVDQLQNTGDRPLRSLEVRLPGGPSFGEPSVRVLIEGVEVSPQRASTSDPRMARAPFEPVWEENQKREVVSEWDLAPETVARGTIAASPNGFFIADPTALPRWQTPSGVFARGGSNPDKELLTIFAPPEFRVLAPGNPLKRAVEGKLVAQRFRIDPKTDFLPYVVAGRYQEKVIRSERGEVEFWTFRPIEARPAQTMAERLSSSMKALADYFGPASIKKTAVRIAESPVELPAEFSVSDDGGGISFPRGVLLDPHFVQQDLASEAVLQLAEYELARTWFGWIVRPRADAQILMGRGVGLFGLVIAAESRGPDERRRMIVSLIDRFDEARAIAADKRLMEPPAGYSRAERISTGYRAALFFVALEDECGRDNLAAALRDIIHARAGSDISFEGLRAAAESESHKDLAEMFRIWLIHPGVPEGFRARYGMARQARLRN